MKNKLKVSYLLSTAKPPQCAQWMVDYIRGFEQHEHEIVICSPDTSLALDGVKFVLDDRCTGGVYGFNKAYSVSDGDIVCLCSDDHALPKDFLRIFDYFDTEEFKNRNVKIANLCMWHGGPGKKMLLKRPEDQHLNGICGFWAEGEEATRGGVFPRGWPNAAPYEIICFPVFFRESLEKYFDNLIYNTRFYQGYADHWLGWHYGRVKGNDPDLGPPDMYIYPVGNFGQMGRPRHPGAAQDRQIFLDLVKNSHNTTNYNC